VQKPADNAKQNNINRGRTCGREMESGKWKSAAGGSLTMAWLGRQTAILDSFVST